jgi:diketogulonate reductase-like aldo/keto reductase
MSLIETAAMYGDGGQRRLSPNGSNDNTKAFLWLQEFIRIMRPGRSCQKACERSLKRLRIDAIDFMFLHAAGTR